MEEAVATDQILVLLMDGGCIIFAMDNDTVLAIDIGGSKISCGIVDDTGTILTSGNVVTPHSDDPEAVFAVLDELSRNVLSQVGADLMPIACGVGSVGPMTAGGRTVSPLNISPWRDFPLLSRLQEVVQIPTFVDNDAKALALGEGWIGGARGEANYISMVVSTGIGGGIVLDGRLLDGNDGNAGHIGHVIVVPDGRQCSCGSFGCLEAEASGSAIQATTGRHPREASDQVVDRTGTLVGLGVASVMNLLDLRLCTIAGSVALGYGDRFFSAANRELAQRSHMSYTSGAIIRPCGLGSKGPLIGASAVGWRGIGRLGDMPGNVQA